MQKESKVNFSKILRQIKSKPLDRVPGFGKYAMLEGRRMNSNGSFNVIRLSISFWDKVYCHLVTMRWGHFLLIIFSFFLLINLVFSFLYVQLGMDSFTGAVSGDAGHNFMQAFFFSSQTLTTKVLTYKVGAHELLEK